jgi:hypothetical protein
VCALRGADLSTGFCGADFGFDAARLAFFDTDFALAARFAGGFRRFTEERDLTDFLRGAIKLSFRISARAHAIKRVNRGQAFRHGRNGRALLGVSTERPVLQNVERN